MQEEVKKILVTGGLGYIGAHTAKALVAQGFSVTILDNIWHGNPNAVRNTEVIKGDIGDRELLNNLFYSNKFAAGMHFAGLIQVGESVEFPEKYHKNNVNG